MGEGGASVPLHLTPPLSGLKKGRKRKETLNLYVKSPPFPCARHWLLGVAKCPTLLTFRQDSSDGFTACVVWKRALIELNMSATDPKVKSRAVDPHSFFADADPALKMWIWIQPNKICNKLPVLYEVLELE